MIQSLAETLRRPNRFQVAIVVLVGISGGLVAVTVGAPLGGILISTVVGMVLGIALAAYLTHIVPEGGATNRPGRRRRR